MIIETTETATLEMVIKLIDSIIWPVTLLLIVLIFRRKLNNAFQRLGSIKADSSGIAINFDKQLEDTKKIFNAIKPKAIAKEAIGIKTYMNQSDTPYKQILDVRSSIINYLKLKSEAASLNTDSLLPNQISKSLLNLHKIEPDQAKMIDAMLELTKNANANTTQEQADIVDTLFEQINI